MSPAARSDATSAAAVRAAAKGRARASPASRRRASVNNYFLDRWGRRGHSRLPLHSHLLFSAPPGDDSPRIVRDEGGRSSCLDVANLPCTTTVSPIPAAAPATAPTPGLLAGKVEGAPVTAKVAPFLLQKLAEGKFYNCFLSLKS